MKKITLLLLMLISGTAFGQTTVSSAAEIIEAIKFTEVTGLNFGKLDNTAGTVIIDYAGTPTGTKTQIAGGVVSAAELTVTGEPDEAYSITVGETATLTESVSSATMDVTGITHDANETLDASGNETVHIGGTLTVGASQTTGSYTGTISVTVAYN
ncbi:DUF4402 domain-containing protein [Salinimicrobium gaetbulicola]|uniref:DUF4402 domain-containing protein n=1 Tax=Salinimicrobium gaetbulicola TaxID=999702 RepID=A0ABW3ICA9_9FLAO